MRQQPRESGCCRIPFIRAAVWNAAGTGKLIMAGHERLEQDQRAILVPQ